MCPRKCCCRRCDQVRLKCHPCCRCIPSALCATIHGCGLCDGQSYPLRRAGRRYAGGVGCLDEGNGIDLTVSLEQDDQAYEPTCYWHVVSQAADLDERFDIDGSDDCRDPQLSVEVDLYDCAASIEIRALRVDRLPLEKREGCWEPFCGTCRCVCRELCLLRYRANEGDEAELETHLWDKDAHAWGPVRLVREEYTGDCWIEIDGYDSVPLEPDHECGTELWFETQNTAGERLEGFCKQCRCQVIGCCAKPMPAQLHLTLNNWWGMFADTSPAFWGALWTSYCIPDGWSRDHRRCGEIIYECGACGAIGQPPCGETPSGTAVLTWNPARFGYEGEYAGAFTLWFLEGGRCDFPESHHEEMHYAPIRMKFFLGCDLGPGGENNRFLLHVSYQLQNPFTGEWSEEFAHVEYGAAVGINADCEPFTAFLANQFFMPTGAWILITE